MGTIPDLYEEAHWRLPVTIRQLPTSHPEYQEALKTAVEAITRERALEKK